MIIKFKVKNFYSIKDKQEISFKISKKDKLDNSSTNIDDNLYLNNIACLVGHNGSGKTKVLNALAFLLFFTQNSYERQDKNKNIELEPHKLSENKNTFFEIEFIKNNKLYLYKLELNQEMIVNEYLGVHKEKGYSFLYKSNRDSEGKLSIDFSDKEIRLTEKDSTRLNEMKNITAFSFLRNGKYLSLMAIENIIEKIKYNRENSGFHGLFSNYKEHEIAMKFLENPILKKNTLELMQDCDFGISDILIKEANSKDAVLGSLQKIFLKHKNNKKSFELPIYNESHGTQNSISLSVDLFNILEKGGLFIIDEIESGIHPYVVKKLISIFADEEINKNNAQLIFSTHQPWFLQDRTKTQIFLLEKNKELSTEVWRLDEMEGIRNDENYFAKYLAGAYGAVPEMNWL